jgi:hypothetical protein
MATSARKSVFISYAQQDRAFADLIKGYLIGRRDLGVFTDSDIAAGDNWQDTLAAALDGSDIVILLISPAFLASKWNLYEAGMALAKDRAHQGTVIPILVGDVDQAALPASLRRPATLDGRNTDQRRVLEQLDQMLAQEAA